MTKLFPVELWGRILEFIEDPSCKLCSRRYETNMSLLQRHEITRTHRLPVQCSKCPAVICFDCVLRIHSHEMQMREGGFPGSPCISCPTCEQRFAIRVNNPIVDPKLVSSYELKFQLVDAIKHYILEQTTTSNGRTLRT